MNTQIKETMAITLARNKAEWTAVQRRFPARVVAAVIDRHLISF